MYSPRMWRWILRASTVVQEGAGILHVCGGDPWITYLQFVLILYSPRMWRLFFEDESSTGKIIELST